MRNTKIRTIPLMISLASAVLLSLSCMTVPKNISKNWIPSVKPRTSAPVDAFALVAVKYTSYPTDCESTEEDFDCKELLSELPAIIAFGTGSGILVDSAIGAVVMTAAHVCENDIPNSFEYDDISITISSTVKITLEVPTKGNYEASIVKMDKEKDLCLLKPTTVFTHPVPLSKNSPKLGDIVYSISAPYGIVGSDLALIFRGFYSGKDTLDDDREVRFYTVPARPGSSGGPVFNKNWELIGIIHTAFSTIENVGIGAGLEDIRTFLYPSSE